MAHTWREVSPAMQCGRSNGGALRASPITGTMSQTASDTANNNRGAQVIRHQASPDSKDEPLGGEVLRRSGGADRGGVLGVGGTLE
eukprot:10040720-Ditylum_brightwellii.AAC.1